MRYTILIRKVTNLNNTSYKKDVFSLCLIRDIHLDLNMYNNETFKLNSVFFRLQNIQKFHNVNQIHITVFLFYDHSTIKKRWSISSIIKTPKRNFGFGFVIKLKPVYRKKRI